MITTIFMNTAETITVVELDGQFFPFINVSGDAHDPHKLIKLIFCPPVYSDEDVVNRRTFSTCLSFAWRTARKGMAKQKALDKKWNKKGRNYNCNYPGFRHNFSFRVMDYIDAWDDDKKIWTTK